MVDTIENRNAMAILKPPFHNVIETLEIEEKKLYEYLLLLSPHGFVRQRIINEKSHFIKNETLTFYIILRIFKSEV